MYVEKARPTLAIIYVREVLSAHGYKKRVGLGWGAPRGVAPLLWLSCFDPVQLGFFGVVHISPKTTAGSPLSPILCRKNRPGLHSLLPKPYVRREGPAYIHFCQNLMYVEKARHYNCQLFMYVKSYLLECAGGLRWEPPRLNSCQDAYVREVCTFPPPPPELPLGASAAHSPCCI